MKGRYRTGDQTLLREINLSTMLRYLHSSAPLSRSALADLTGLNKTTVSSLVEELSDRGLVCEVGIDYSRTGRPATLLDLNPDAGTIIGVALGVDFVAIVLTDFGGNIRWRRRQATDPAQSREAMLALTLDMAEEAVAANRDHGALRLLGLGIATPGTVNVDEGLLIFSPNLQWHNVPYRDIFQARLSLPVLVDNDANAAALAEHMFGVARQAQTFVSVFAGVGVGGGLFLNGELYRGVGGFAGEIGHTNFTLEHYRRPCRCGQRGCWETTVAQDSVIERIRSRLVAGRQSRVAQLMAEQNSPPTLTMVVEAAHAGDLEAIEVLTETGHLLGIGIANLINIFNPEMIVLGGPLSTASNYLLPAIHDAIRDSTLPEIRDQAEVVLSAFGADASLIGAVALVVDDILARPSSVERWSRHSCSRAT